MISLGCDVGTITAKTVILKDGEIVAFDITPNEGKLSQAVERSVQNALSKAGVTLEDIENRGGTGFGERYISFPHVTKSTISCLSRGVNRTLPSVRTVVDIGGLSTTCIHINDQGKVMEYRTNDRCASGTGFFLELAAQALELNVEDFSSVAASAREKVRISAQCAVFGESEIVSHINDGVDAASIVAGISLSIGSGLATTARRLGVEPEIVATGGVAKLAPVLKALEEDLGVEVQTPEWDPQLAAAIGAALPDTEQ